MQTPLRVVELGAKLIRLRWPAAAGIVAHHGAAGVETRAPRIRAERANEDLVSALGPPTCKMSIVVHAAAALDDPALGHA